MHKVQLVALVTSGVSIVAILACLCYVPVLYTRLSAITAELHEDMDEFRSLSNSVHGHIQELAGPATGRGRRQAPAAGSNCQCEAQSRCPAGPAGKPGSAGEPGLAGQPGPPGEKGEAGIPPPIKASNDTAACKKVSDCSEKTLLRVAVSAWCAW